MKIINPTAFALACLVANVSARNFTAPEDGSGSMKDNIKTAANFDSKGVNMEVCPSGDCKNGKFMRLTVASLTELNAKGEKVASVTKFKPKDSDWTAIEEEEIDGATVSSTTFVSTVEVGSSKTEVTFNLKAQIFQGDATVEYGSQDLMVPAGALKFTVDIGVWPFAATTNTLTLAVKLDAKGPKGADIGKPEKKPKVNSTSNPIERVDMGDSMFMDAPSIVILDDVEKDVTNSSVVTLGADTMFEWVFPSYTKMLHYDPVLGEDTTSSASASASSSTSMSTSSSGSTSESSSGSTSTSSASKLSLSGLAAAALTALAYSFF